MTGPVDPSSKEIDYLSAIALGAEDLAEQAIQDGYRAMSPRLAVLGQRGDLLSRAGANRTPVWTLAILV